MGNLLSSPSPPPLPPPSQPPSLPLSPSSPKLKPSDEPAFNLLVEAAEANVPHNVNGNGEVRVLKRCRESAEKSAPAEIEVEAEAEVEEKSLTEHVKDWVQRRIEAGVPHHRCSFPFLTHAPKMVECYRCLKFIYPEDAIECSIRGCNVVFHLLCAKQTTGSSSLKDFKCPQHACYLCNKKNHLWRCMKCQIASHDKCAAFPEYVIHYPDQPGRVICWRHPMDLCSEKKKELPMCAHSAPLLFQLSPIQYTLCCPLEVCTTNIHRELAVPENNFEDIFSQLPLPCREEEFRIGITWKDPVENTLEPPPYSHIRRNIYLTKKKRDDIGADIGCTNCKDNQCSDDCVCRVQCITCSKACRCSEMCCNRPFRKEKKIKIVKTEFCGWGVVAAEQINKGDFIIEYVGEVIDDALCEKRLWDMKYEGVSNFYMCEIRKDFTIDATFKGNSSRFLNHSCDPNCNLEKWQVEGETRVGVFAARSIEVGEPLTYDYRFVQFGPEVKCHCGAPNCQGYLGTKKKIEKLNLIWGSKRKRTPTSTTCLVIVRN